MKNAELSQFTDLWADLTADFIDNLKLDYTNPFAEFPQVKLVQCRLRFDFQETPYIIFVEAEAQ